MRTRMHLHNANSTASVNMGFGGTNRCSLVVVQDELTPPAPNRMKPIPSGLGVVFGILITKPLKSIYDRLIPLGYEDEQGFHYGEK